jgi:hypothetical protein
MTLFKDFKRINADGYLEKELYYSVLHFIGGNPSWYCRFWDNHRIIGEGYGKTKFEAYRKAMSGNIIKKYKR